MSTLLVSRFHGPKGINTGRLVEVELNSMASDLSISPYKEPIPDIRTLNVKAGVLLHGVGKAP